METPLAAQLDELIGLDHHARRPRLLFGEEAGERQLVDAEQFLQRGDRGAHLVLLYHADGTVGQAAQLGGPALGEPETTTKEGEPLSHGFIHPFVRQGVIRHGLPLDLALWLLHPHLLVWPFEYLVTTG